MRRKNLFHPTEAQSRLCEMVIHQFWPHLFTFSQRPFTTSDNNNPGARGNYLPSSLGTDCPYYAYNVYFRSDNVNCGVLYRFNGQSVRPVTE